MSLLLLYRWQGAEPLAGRNRVHDAGVLLLRFFDAIILGGHSLSELGVKVDARRFIYDVTISDCIQLAVRLLQDIATSHGGGVVVAQLVLGLLAMADALSDVALVAASEDCPDVSKVSDGVVLSQEGLNLLVSRLINTFDCS